MNWVEVGRVGYAFNFDTVPKLDRIKSIGLSQYTSLLTKFISSFFRLVLKALSGKDGHLFILIALRKAVFNNFSPEEFSFNYFSQ